MDTKIKPQNLAERVVWYTLLLTYPLYLSGFLFPVNTALPWILLVGVVWQLRCQSNWLPRGERVYLPAIVCVWILAALMLPLITLINLLDMPVALPELMRSNLNWMREWALLPVCFTLGCYLRIRPQIIYRAVCWVCVQSFGVLGLSWLAYRWHWPAMIYQLPIDRVVALGKSLYAVQWYIFDTQLGTVQFPLFAPWGGALGLIAGIYLVLALRESHKGWRRLGLCGAMVMLLASLSHLALLVLPLTLFLVAALFCWNRTYLKFGMGRWVVRLGRTLTQGLPSLSRPWKVALPGLALLLPLLQALSFDKFADASTDMALITEVAMLHQVKPQLLEPIMHGTLSQVSHSWSSLWVNYGAVGCMVMAIAMVTTVVVLVMQSKFDRTARVALGIVLMLLFMSIGENVERLIYLVWPSLVLVGSAFRPRTGME